jgi:hypothetical protein
VDCAGIARWWCLLRTHAGGGKRPPWRFQCAEIYPIVGGLERSRASCNNPQPAGLMGAESMQLLRYSLFTPRRYELNMSSTSNSSASFFCISSGQTGACMNYSAPTSTGTCRRKKLGKAFSPTACSISPPAAALGSHATVRSTYRPASGPFCTCQRRAILQQYGQISAFKCRTTQLFAIAIEWALANSKVL